MFTLNFKTKIKKLILDERGSENSTFLDNCKDFIVSKLIRVLPDIPVLNIFKSHIMRIRGAKIGLRVKLLESIFIDRFYNLTIFDDVSIGSNVTFGAIGGIEIGSRTMIGHGSIIMSSGHIIPPGKESMRFSGAFSDKVIIGRDVWVGAKVIILPGIHVGEGAIIGAGSVVTKKVLPYSVIGGNPAQIIRMRL